jgi:purine-nucleoside phosphorylase
MSTNFELHAGAEAGMVCAAISLITNRAAGLGEGPLDHREVLAMAQKTAERLGALIEVLLKGENEEIKKRELPRAECGW